MRYAIGIHNYLLENYWYIMVCKIELIIKM